VANISRSHRESAVEPGVPYRSKNFFFLDFFGLFKTFPGLLERRENALVRWTVPPGEGVGAIGDDNVLMEVCYHDASLRIVFGDVR
jgi:hypothetical protein